MTFENVTTSPDALRPLMQLAAETFETEDEAKGWLDRQHPLLDHATPRQMAHTAAGAERVKCLLIAIKYGGVA
jgi:uncharacterized protein (DUF2384 family)